MRKYILVYEISGVSGGAQIEFFGRFDDPGMHIRVNALATEHGDKFTVIFAGEIASEFDYKAVDVVKEYRPEKK